MVEISVGQLTRKAAVVDDGIAGGAEIDVQLAAEDVLHFFHAATELREETTVLRSADDGVLGFEIGRISNAVPLFSGDFHTVYVHSFRIAAFDGDFALGGVIGERFPHQSRHVKVSVEGVTGGRKVFHHIDEFGRRGDPVSRRLGRRLYEVLIGDDYGVSFACKIEGRIQVDGCRDALGYHRGSGALHTADEEHQTCCCDDDD